MSQTAEPNPTPSPTPAPSVPADPFEGVSFPDKFKKDGKPDLKSFVTSYGELEGKLGGKVEALKAELYNGRPESADKYALPAIEGVDPAELGKHPLVEWWRKQAFESGIPQEVFAKGVEQYVTSAAPQEIPEDTLKAELGEAFKSRIAAVDTWAQATAKTPGELAALQAAVTSPDGIKLMERLMGLSDPVDPATRSDPPKTLDLETLRAMQQEPRYWDPAQRDPAFVKSVEAGYEKLYPVNSKVG